jgi:hypothetical protein
MPSEKDIGQTGAPNYTKEAFQWQYNVIGLAGAAAAAIVTGTALPLVLAAGVELMYLATVPQMARFQRLIRSKKFEEEKRRHDERLKQMMNALPPDVRDRYRHLESIAMDIRRNYDRLSSSSQIFVGQLQDQLRGLLTSYVRLASADVQHIQYLQSTNPDYIRREAARIKDGLGKETAKVQEINSKRIEILEKRLEKYQKIRENRQVIEAQCRAVEDVLQLIRDQSITMADPQQVSDRLENLVKDVEHTEDSVREMEAIFQLAPEADSFGGGDTSLGRDRLRS